jgi:hypothetical protein
MSSAGAVGGEGGVDPSGGGSASALRPAQSAAAIATDWTTWAIRRSGSVTSLRYLIVGDLVELI